VRGKDISEQFSLIPASSAGQDLTFSPEGRRDFRVKIYLIMQSVLKDK